MSISKSPMDAAQPLTAEELVLLRTLQDRALRSKKAELLPESSVFRGQGFPSQPDPNDDAVSEWSEVDAGNMTDSSKRRLGPDMAPLSYPGASMMSPMPMPVAMNGPLYPMSSATSFGMTKKGTAITLPPGVDTLATWGKTLIEFGKFASKDLDYNTLVAANDKESVSYRKWCKSQVDAAEGRLKDLALFLWAHDAATGQSEQGPVFPGTNDVRRFKGD